MCTGLTYKKPQRLSTRIGRWKHIPLAVYRMETAYCFNCRIYTWNLYNTATLITNTIPDLMLVNRTSNCQL